MRLAPIAVCLLVLSAGCAGVSPSVHTPVGSKNPAETVQSPNQPTTPSSERFEADVDRIEDLVHQKMNDRREANGVEPLARNETLNRVARYKSWDMAQRDYFGHVGPNGTSHHDLRVRFGTPCSYYGQNIHVQKQSGNKPPSQIRTELYAPDQIAIDAVNSLLNSTGHRQNALSTNYDSQGIGVFVDETGSVYVTQEFCG